MKNRRRDFLKLAGLTGLGIAGGGLSKGFASDSKCIEEPNLPQLIKQYGQLHEQRFNMSGFAAPKISNVRVGIIGLGQRGPSHVQRMSIIEGVEIRALCDLLPEKAEAAKKNLEGTGHNPGLYAGGRDEWKKLCDRDDLDLVIITTPWYMHAEMGIYAMEHGKHVASEVPAAGTIEECWKLVETAERTRKHFMMMENDAYMEFQMLTLNMARKGFFGEVVHGDCAYNTSKMKNNFSKSLYWDMWWLKQYASRKGNIYPTHGLGPVSQIMDINRGDSFDFLVSVESNDFMMNRRAMELAETDDFFKPFTGKDYRGNMNVTVIRTKKGRTIMLQHDATSPSPHNIIHGISGTKGTALYDPQPPRLATGNHEWVSQEEFQKLKEKYTPEIFMKMGTLARDSGHGGSDLLLSWRLIDCLHNGLPLDQDVYDAASLSSVIPLSEWSVRNRSNSVDIPDFTAGKWRTNKQNMDINLEKGGNTKVKG
ncbi:MAG: Gfo/Idh/MocA family oxidoreductase [Prolixibacteraceae bacterium]|nr:Gfo/Idh/MocA family oxidoreductase [Prolixibacteraceae bacterium]